MRETKKQLSANRRFVFLIKPQPQRKHDSFTTSNRTPRKTQSNLEGRKPNLIFPIDQTESKIILGFIRSRVPIPAPILSLPLIPLKDSIRLQTRTKDALPNGKA